jgi:spore maturation protein CgeB
VINPKQLGKVFLNRRADDTYHIVRPRVMAQNAGALLRPTLYQIKARVFEIPACRGFMITEFADGLEDYFVPGKEVITFHTADEMVESVRYFLSHEQEREQIRRAGYERAMRDHSYVRRFEDLFQRMGVYEQVQ